VANRKAARLVQGMAVSGTDLIGAPTVSAYIVIRPIRWCPQIYKAGARVYRVATFGKRRGS
jgi:hypothetical protein